jgi:tripartite-type tricarboxylate transporter receptor subunit TctC
MSAEAGMPQLVAETWNALFAPAGTPGHLIARLSDAAREAQPASLAAGGIAEVMAEASARGLPIDVLEADVSVAAEVQRVVKFTMRSTGKSMPS